VYLSVKNTCFVSTAMEMTDRENEQSCVYPGLVDGGDLTRMK